MNCQCALEPNGTPLLTFVKMKLRLRYRDSHLLLQKPSFPEYLVPREVSYVSCVLLKVLHYICITILCCLTSYPLTCYFLALFFNIFFHVCAKHKPCCFDILLLCFLGGLCLSKNSDILLFCCIFIHYFEFCCH